MSITPVSNDALFVRLALSPVKRFIAAGMNVALATDGPMLFHMNPADPLLEARESLRSATLPKPVSFFVDALTR